ncbi:MAG: hypothetical protein PSX36_07665 [bacterium]|nr:hypothetical protein [bacterium]
MSAQKFHFFTLYLVYVLFSPALKAQTYPSALVTILNAPNTLFLDEYTDPFHPKIKTTIHFTDFTEPSWTFNLRLKISGPNGILIQTKPGARPNYPFVVAPGVAYEIQGADLDFYFNYNNLTFNGISRTELEKNNRLPEGYYTFCFEALDFESSKLLSHPSCASAYLSLNDPAIIISPTGGSVVENISQQNVFFQWQVSNATGNLNMSQLSYQLDLYEVNNAWSNPVNAILNNQALPIWQSSPIYQNSYLYTNIDPPLTKGKRYVFTVKTIESSGRCSFKNNGVSMPYYFHYGYFENDTIAVITPEDNFQFALSTPSQFKWKKPPKAISNQMVTYTLKLVEVGSNQDPDNAILYNTPFYQQEYLPTSELITEKIIPVTFWMAIKRMGHYAWQVTARSGSQQVAKSEVHIFTGPPDIESFIAGGFLMSVTKLTYFNKTTNVISGRCKTTLNSAWNTPTEFGFTNISISSLGNNEWVMTGGLIADKIITPSYTLQPKTFVPNKTALFRPDSVFVTTSGVSISGKTEWNFPHAGTSQQREKIVSQRCLLNLANFSFYLSNSEPVLLSKNYQIPLLEPLGFVFKINQSSNLNVYQSTYEFDLNGFVQLPNNVKNGSNSGAHVSFQHVNQVHYISQSNSTSSENIILAKNTQFGFQPTQYILDLYERQSPGEFAADSMWKGLFIQQAKLELPKLAENSGQITLPVARAFTFTNTLSDTNKAYVTHHGLTLTSTIPFLYADSVKFNSFLSKSGYFYSKLTESEIDRAFISGGIYVPVIDTLNSFPYFIELSDFGFYEGYLTNGLANRQFTFNPTGSAEQKIPITIKRAVFKNHNHLEMDLDMSWPYFNLNLTGVQRFSVWGNGNIGFDVPNGKAALTYQASGKASNFDITVDYLGCGRNGNAYAFGASAKINMDEEISGDNGAPVINAYSIYKNPLLSGMVFVPPTSTNTSSTGTVSTNTGYQSSTASYTNALGNGLTDALGQLGFQASDTLNFDAQFNNEAAITPMLSGNTIIQLKQIIDIIYRLKPFIKTESITDKDWLVLDRFKNALNADVIQQAQVTNSKGVLNFVLNKVVESIILEINGPIQNISNKAMGKVRTAINSRVVAPINAKIDTSISTVIRKLQQRILVQVDEQYHPIVINAFLVVKTNLINGINTSVSNSFENNVTSKITDFVKFGVTSKIKNFVRIEVSAAGAKLIQDGVNANINLSDILDNAGSMFESIGDTVKDVIVNTNAANFVNTAESLVDDAISGINWDAIANQILNELIVKGLSNVLANQIAQAVGQNAGPYVSAVLNTVKFDFTNLGEKLQNGQFDKIVKFDVTNIYLETPAVDIRGALRFTKNDPLFGDSWQANVMVRVKVPKKDNPIEITAFFLNGKTTQRPQNFTYWFAKLSVSGFSVPLNPAPVIWDGVEGYAFSKMKKTGLSSVIPDMTNKFGVGCKFYFYDQQSSGKTYMFDLGAEAEFNEGGFAIQLVGNASVFNYQKTSGKYHPPGFVTGTGTLGYYKTPECTKIAGNFSVKFNTEPILCAGGDVGLDLKTPNDWKVWAGTQQNPIGVKIICKDFLSNTAFMEASNSGFTTGISMNVAIAAQSPWVQFSGVRMRSFTNLNFGYNAYASIEWDPTFKINEATISAWLSAAIGIDYETSTVSSSLTLAGISLAGTLTYKSQPESELHGSMSGSITVIGYNLGFNTPVHYSLSKQQIIN